MPFLNRRLGLGALLLVAGRPLPGQMAPADAPSSDTLRVVPGAHYAAGGLHRFFFGRHYRDLWSTPVTALVLDLEHMGGGLTATERGGGQQTRSLRFRATDGREYAFRSVEKDPSVVLPEELRGTVANDIIQDQISSSHPAGALVAPPLLEAAGIPHADPRLVVLPDSPRLGEFRAEFAGVLGLFEERPSTDGDIVPGAAKVISSDALFRRVEESPDDRVDARALLTARLMDGFLGDWDRHRDQWRWATFDRETPRRWVPIPRDRDQAFVRFDGLLLAIARGQAPQLVNFGPRYPAAVGLTWNGRELDRRFLVGLERPAWGSAAAALRGALTDAVIDSAVARLPEAYLRMDGARLAAALKQRRDHLPEFAARFYRLLAGEVDVHATDEADLVRAESREPHHLRLTMLRPNAAEPWFDRTFDDRETGEVRVYLHGGADLAFYSGGSSSGIAVRFVGGGGRDTLVDSTGGHARFYDVDSGTVATGAGLDARPYSTGPKRSETALPPRDWGSRVLPLLWAGGGPDIGVLVGAGIMWTDYGFRQQPYAAEHRIRVGYATGADEAKAEYHGVIHGEGRGRYLDLFARASGIETLRFHGLGNETRISNSRSFYRVRQIEVLFEPSLVFPVSRGTRVLLGPTVRYSNTKQGNRFIDQARPYGADHFGMVGGRAVLQLDDRDIPANATRGVLLEAGGALFPELFDVRTTFGELHASASTYLGAAAIPTHPVLALRVGARQILGTAPYHEAAYIGDIETVRLGRENRYGGDAALWGNAELRLAFGGYHIIVPGQWGIFGLGDVGRVFLDGESSDAWHGAYGGGLWFGFLGRANTVSIAWAQSAERGKLYLRAGMAY